MTIKANAQAQEQTLYVPVITTVAMPLLLFGRRKKMETTSQTTTPTTQPPKEKPKRKPKPTGVTVAKYEIAEDKVKFYTTKGLLKKRWVLLKEFPVYELTAVESVGNWLNLTWNGTAYPFLLKKKAETFTKLQQQILALLEERKLLQEKEAKAALRKSELLGAINASLPVVDSAFDLLMGLHAKRVDWTRQEAYAQPLGSALDYKAQGLPPLNIDFTKLSETIKAQAAKETSKETLNVLKAIHGYFANLKPEDDLAQVTPNFEQTKALVLAYLALNDLLLARTIGEKDSKKEAAFMEENLSALSNATNFKVAVEPVMACLDRVGVEVEGVSGVDEARALFVIQLKQF